MSVICPPKIEEDSPEHSDFTEVCFEPDLKKFGMDKLSSDMESLLVKRVYDIAGCTPGSVNV